MHIILCVYYAGVSLPEQLRKSPRPPAQTVFVGTNEKLPELINSGVQYLHYERIIHCKPFDHCAALEYE